MSQQLPSLDPQEAGFSRKQQGATVLVIAVLLGLIATDIAGFLLGLLAEPRPDRDAIMRDRLAWLQILPALAGPLLVLGAYRITEDRQHNGISAALSTSTRVATLLFSGILLVYLFARLSYDGTPLRLAVGFVRNVTDATCFVFLSVVSAKLLRHARARRVARLGIALSILYPIARLGIPVLDAALTHEAFWILLSAPIEFMVSISTAALFLGLYSTYSHPKGRASSNRHVPTFPEYRAPAERVGGDER